MGKKTDGTDETKELIGEGIPQETQKADDATQKVKPEEEPVSATEADAPKAEEEPDADHPEQKKVGESAGAENPAETEGNISESEKTQEEEPTSTPEADKEADQYKQDVEVKTTKEPAKSDYTVHGCNIRHNGVTYKEGTKISLTAEEAYGLKQYVRA